MPRVIGAITSARCLSGVTIISIAVMKATKLPTVPPLCHSAATMTADSAIAASTCVTGVIVAAAATDFIISRRSRSSRWTKRAVCACSAPCRRTMRQASTFSSTT
jgi:hypothetical protein